MKERRTGDITAMIEHQFRRSFGEIVAALTRRFGTSRISLAEDAAQEALVAAMRAWPFSGIPDNPAGWLYKVARNRALDTLRSAGERLNQNETFEALSQLKDSASNDIDFQHYTTEIRDDHLRLMFTCCHPAISLRNQIALTLRLVSGLSPEEVAAALLTSKSAVQQQIVRAKRALRRSDIPFELPPPDQLPERLSAVLRILYLVFNSGYAAPEGDSAIREDLCVEALRLIEPLLQLSATALPAVHALAALFCAQLARFPARLDEEGKPIPLPRQDRSLWDQALIAKALHHHRNAASGEQISPYHFEAAIAVEHCIATSFEETNWRYILENYNGLLALTDSPVVALNRIVAVAQVHGAVKALAELDKLQKENSLSDYYLLPAVRAALLEDLGKSRESAAEYCRSRELCRNSAYARWLDSQLAGEDSTDQAKC